MKKNKCVAKNLPKTPDHPYRISISQGFRSMFLFEKDIYEPNHQTLIKKHE